MKRLVLLTTLLLTLLSGLTLAAPPRAHAQTFSCNNVTEIPIAECNELVTLYNSTGGANWKNKTGWLTTNTPCSWFGITCNAGHVSEIYLDDDGNTSDEIYGNNLMGTIPNLNLPNLTWFNVNYNKLGGTIPNFTNLPNLTGLYLSANQLNGTIPNFNNLPRLTYLYLAVNQLSGDIPDFSNLPNLTEISLHYNQLVRAIPNFTNLSKLKVIYLGYNQLSGTIPDFSNLPNLTQLYLFSNQLSGTIPHFSNLPNLTQLGIDSNQLSGTIPNLNWSKFEWFKLNNNCGLVAFNDAQVTVLTSKDPDWQVRNPNCATVITPTATTAPPTPTNTPSPTPTNTPTPTPIPPDPYEIDNICPEAKPLLTDGTIQEHTFHAQADTDWAVFQAISGTTYLIQAQTPPQSTADVVLEAYSQCGGVTFDNQGYTFSPDVRLQIKAPNSGPFYLKLNNQRADVFGSQVSYQLSVRALADSPTTGAVIIVAGKIKENDFLQPNIYHVTDEVYAMFAKHGYSDDRIYYLAPDLNHAHVDTAANLANLESAITIWAQDKVGPNQPLTLYLMDHGGEEEFYLDKQRGEWVTPTQLDGWLTRLEQAKPGVTVNLFIEACYSGSFIRPPQSVSKAGRVVMASADADRLAKASADGALFSDQLLLALTQKESLYSSFQTGLGAVQIGNPNQNPILDSNGNGLPNEAADLQLAAQRGFGLAGTLDEQWPPYIVTAKIVAANSELQAEVQDDTQVKRVWAYLYPPSYQPPANTGNEMIQETLTAFLLTNQGNNRWAGKYPAMTESGTYRLVIYAEDDKGLQARPREVAFGGAKIYLPLIVK